MLTKEDIKKNLQNDPFWEPDEDSTDKEWDLYEEVYNEIQHEKTLNKGGKDTDTAHDEEDEIDYLDDEDLEDLKLDEDDEEDDDDSDY